MIAGFVLVFLVGYALIALENSVRINKAAVALMTGVILWVAYILLGQYFVPLLHADSFAYFLERHPEVTSLPAIQQYASFISTTQLTEQLGDISGTLFFLIGAMTIVEVIDLHDGFSVITDKITSKNHFRLLFIITIVTFFMSAVLDNMTTAIIMVALARKLIRNQKMRWIYAGIIIISANSGGAWSPIGDITTIMLWIKGNITASRIIPVLIVPCLVSVLVPMLVLFRIMKRQFSKELAAGSGIHHNESKASFISYRERLVILLLGVICLMLIPVFKTVTHLPPFMGMLAALGVMWVYTEVLYNRKKEIAEMRKLRVTQALHRIDFATILFFLGILLAVAALQETGILGGMAAWLDKEVHNVYIITLIIGILSAVVDNVPLVAGAIGMYPIVSPETLQAMPDAVYMAHFVQDGAFWEFLAYCAGVGGSILIIGSAAGVVVMGIEKIGFIWYLKRISLLALIGYLAGAGVYIFELFLMGHF